MPMIPPRDCPQAHSPSLWRFALLVGGIAFLGLGSLLAITNPRQEQYEQFATEKLVIYLKENVCQPTINNLEETIKSQMCNLIVDTGKNQVPKLIEKTTRRYNYLLLSIYQTDLFLYRFETIGIFNNFVIIEVENIYERE